VQHGVRLACAARYALSLAAAMVLFVGIAAPPTARAAGDPPKHLWRTFPLNGQGTTPDRAVPPPRDVRSTPTPTPTATPTPTGEPAGPSRDDGRGAIANAAIALLLATALVAALVFAETKWAPLRRRQRRLRDWLHETARRRAESPAARGPALAFAAASQPPRAADATARQSPVVHRASRLNPWRRHKKAAGGRSRDTDAENQVPDAVVRRLADYSLAPPREPDSVVALDPPETLAEHPEAQPLPTPETDAPAAEPPPLPEPEELADRREVPQSATAFDTLCTRVDTEIARARDEHLALSIVALQLHPIADVAPDLSGVAEAVESASHELLGQGAKIVVVESEDDIVWLILPGMLAKRAHAVAAQLLEILAPVRHHVNAAAVGFPADGASAELLVRRCLDLIAQASTSQEEVAST
jgi:hypothetical protein